jgi:hypothetical protein
MSDHSNNSNRTTDLVVMVTVMVVGAGAPPQGVGQVAVVGTTGAAAAAVEVKMECNKVAMEVR